MELMNNDMDMAFTELGSFPFENHAKFPGMVVTMEGLHMVGYQLTTP